jgi:hypothetical protein
MTLTITLPDEKEATLNARALARGLSPEEFAGQVLAHQLEEADPEPLSQPRTGQDLIDASASLRGLFTDEEVDTLFSRTFSLCRPVDFGLA